MVGQDTKSVQRELKTIQREYRVEINVQDIHVSVACPQREACMQLVNRLFPTSTVDEVGTNSFLIFNKQFGDRPIGTITEQLVPENWNVHRALKQAA